MYIVWYTSKTFIFAAVNVDLSLAFIVQVSLPWWDFFNI
jgi:hypothetical protein